MKKSKNSVSLKLVTLNPKQLKSVVGGISGFDTIAFNRGYNPTT